MIIEMYVRELQTQSRGAGCKKFSSFFKKLRSGMVTGLSRQFVSNDFANN